LAEVERDFVDRPVDVLRDFVDRVVDAARGFVDRAPEVERDFVDRPAEAEPELRLLRVAAAFLAAAERALAGRAADAAPPARPPLRAGALFVALPRPEPLARPPPVVLLTVAQARRSDSSSLTPRFS
jgi:hypothetical protein